MKRDSGKILFYNEATGDGFIVTRSKEKITFNVSEWEEFEYLPKTGLYVTFEHVGEKALGISVDSESADPDSTDDQNDIMIGKADGKEAIGTESVINDYFRTINDELKKFRHYSKAEHGIDFGKLRRFLLTTYNNLVEIDISIRKSEVSDAKHDLIYLSDIYDEFRGKAKNVKRAFHDLFLNRNDDFVAAEHRLENNKELIAQHDINIKMAEAALEKLERIASQTPPASENYAIVMKKIKVAKAKAVDEIHHKRELEDENRQLAGFIDMIINENEESFTGKFIVQAKLFDEKVTLLLNKLAYTFDLLLWKAARKSRPIKDYFRRSQIKGQLSSITYLKYYLQSLNQDKLSEENKELFDIVTYLQSLRNQSIVYLSSDIDNGMRLKPVITSVDKTISVETTMDFDKAIESIVKKSPNHIFIDFQADYRKLIKTLIELKMIEDVSIVLVIERVNDKVLELAKKMHIEHVLQTRVSALVFAQEISRIIEGQ